MTGTGRDNLIYFIGGAPRSGTTITHALLCTSSRMNAYHPEISYITPIVEAYATGLRNWNIHTKAFFAEREHFKIHMRGLLTQAFTHIYRVLGAPEILSVKDPLLTLYFPLVLALLGNRARFVTVLRHPYDVLRSRQEVAEQAGRAFDDAAARDVALEYNRSYQHIDNAAFGAKLLHFRYEDMLNEDVLTQIKNFTQCPDISPDNVWGTGKQSASKSDAAPTNDPWYSPKYHRAIDLSNRLSPLEARYRAVVDECCAPLMERFGYNSDD